MSETFRTTRAADGNFTILKNTLLQDRLLSSKARGIASYVLSYPPDKHWTVDILANQLLEGPAAIKGGLKELQGRGYMHRSRTQKPNGTWEWDWMMADDIRFEPSVENRLMDSPAETQESPGQTIGRLSASGKPTDKIFKESKPKIKTLKIEDPPRTNGSVGTREDRTEGGDFEVQNPKSAPTDVDPWASDESYPLVDALLDLEDQKPDSNQEPSKGLTPSPLPPFPDPDDPANAGKSEYQLNYECFLSQGASEASARKLARRATEPAYKIDAEEFLNTIPVPLTDADRSRLYPDVCVLTGKGWERYDLAQVLVSGLEGSFSPVKAFETRLRGLVASSRAKASA